MNLSTYSIVARDPKTGYLAFAGGTNWFCYGRWEEYWKRLDK